MIVAARAPQERARMILDVEWVPKPGGEANAAMLRARVWDQLGEPVDLGIFEDRLHSPELGNALGTVTH